jgi:hypothetical protein
LTTAYQVQDDKLEEPNKGHKESIEAPPDLIAARHVSRTQKFYETVLICGKPFNLLSNDVYLNEIR